MLATNNVTVLNLVDAAVEGFGYAHRLGGFVSSNSRLSDTDFDCLEAGLRSNFSQGLQHQRQQSQR